MELVVARADSGQRAFTLTDELESAGGICFWSSTVR
jgi:hypothetical protein